MAKRSAAVMPSNEGNGAETLVEERAGNGRAKAAVIVCIAFAFMTAAFPFWRAFHRVQITYNEGWNVYNTVKVAQHQMLYPAAYSFTTVNYPALSFFVGAQLARFSHEYLFTERVLSLVSLLLCCAMVGAIVRTLTGRSRAALLATFFCLAVFCTVADEYVGMDDPQMFAQVFFLAGLALYIWKRQRIGFLALTALLFVIGGNIKHNLVEFPLAVLVDIYLVSKRRALGFCLMGAALAGISIVLNERFGGPYFIRQMLAPRTYSWDRMLEVFLAVFAPLVPVILIALLTAIQMRRDPERRIVILLLALAVGFGVFFSGGKGVWINSVFGSLLAISILIGIFLDDPSRYLRVPRLETGRWAAYVVFGSLMIPWIISGNWLTIDAMRKTRAAEVRFGQEVNLLKAQPGAALCESLLRCYYADKPYAYDPFNSTRLIQSGNLAPHAIVEQIDNQQFGAIQLEFPVEKEIELGAQEERFTPVILKAIEQNYVLAMEHEKCAIYIPKKNE